MGGPTRVDPEEKHDPQGITHQPGRDISSERLTSTRRIEKSRSFGNCGPTASVALSTSSPQAGLRSIRAATRRLGSLSPGCSNSSPSPATKAPCRAKPSTPSTTPRPISSRAGFSPSIHGASPTPLAIPRRCQASAKSVATTRAPADRAKNTRNAAASTDRTAHRTVTPRFSLPDDVPASHHKFHLYTWLLNGL